MRIFKYRKFSKFAKTYHIDDTKLYNTITDMKNGIVHADLGGNVFKQRISRTGQGKSGGFRVIVFCQMGERAFFVHGFLKSQYENITPSQEDKFKSMARIFLNLSNDEIDQLVAIDEFEEITDHDNS